MTTVTTMPVLVAHHTALMRRILRLNFEAEHIEAIEAGTAQECLHRLHLTRPSVVVLDPEILTDAEDEAAVCRLLLDLGLPVLVVSDGPEHRHVARTLGDVPFCSRPDNVDCITAAVRSLMSGALLPALL